jgi:ABC-type lipoprotein release transport system permease subunit
MLLILRLAWRSFTRHRRRTIITVSAVSLSLAMMLVFVGLGDDGHARMAMIGIRLGAGHVLIQGAGYQKAQTLDHLVQHPDKVLAAARRHPLVKVAVPRVRANGLLTTGESSAPVLVSGVDPTLEPRVSDIPDPRRRVAGAYLRQRSAQRYKNQPADIYIGAELAKTLELQVGDRAVLTLSPRAASRPASAAFIVRGIFKTGVSELNQSYVEVPLSELQRLLKLGPAVTQVALHLHELEQTAAVTADLKAQVHRDLEVLSWEEALKELYDAIVLDDAGLYLMMAIIFIIVAIGIFNTVLMSVVERTREFGVMLALGTAPGQLFRIVMTEALILAFVAAAVGLAVGLGLHSWIAATGIDIGSMAGDYEIGGITLEGRIYSKLSLYVVAKWTLVVMGMTIAAALYPALRGTRLQPVEAIRHV